MEPHRENDTGRSSPLTAEQALAFWFGRINYEVRAAQPGDLKLERMHALAERLGNPQERYPIVHVAGSKGKGSTSAMLAAVLTRAGYRTGLFTSPHLCRVEERIQVNGEPIPSGDLTALLNEVAPAVRALDRAHGPDGEAITFFEVATALGFLHFARQKVDVAVLEVGLGGRFDSTNICRPLVSLITSISLDHTKQLGDRPAQIAMEKAGIVKPGRPALSGAVIPEARQVIEEICRERGAPLRQLGREIHYHYEPGRWRPDAVHAPRVRVETDRRGWPVLQLGLWGEHQAANAALAVAAVEHLEEAGFRIGEGALAAGLAQVRWPARLEVLGRRPLVVLDCAHNVASAAALAETLRASFPDHAGPARKGKRLLVFAGSSDKDLAGILRELAPHFDRLFLTRFRSNLRSVPPETLLEKVREFSGVPCDLFTTSEEAWQAARAAAGPEDLLCVTGSVFLAGEVRPLILAN